MSPITILKISQLYIHLVYSMHSAFKCEMVNWKHLKQLYFLQAKIQKQCRKI